MTAQTKKRLIGIGRYLFWAALILFIILTIQECRRDDGLLPAQKKDYYQYKTDSIYKDKYFALLKLYDKKTPPKVVEKWLPGEPGKDRVDSIKVIPGELLVYIQGLEKELQIKEGFLSKYPNAHKLIEFKLGKDSLEITTLDQNADIFTKYYPLYLDNFKYQWYDNELHNSEFFSKPEKKQRQKVAWNRLYLNGGYEFQTKVPMTGLEYNLELGRFKIDGELKGTFEKNTQLNATAKVGFRLFK